MMMRVGISMIQMMRMMRMMKMMRMLRMMRMMRISLCNHRRRKAKRDNTCQVVYWSLHFTDYNRYQHHHSQEDGCGEVEDEMGEGKRR